MEARAAHGRRDGEADLDQVVEAGLEVELAQVAVAVRVDAAQGAEAANDVAADGAEQVPLHLEEAELRGVKEEVDGDDFGEAAVATEAHRVDAEELRVLALPQEAAERRHQVLGPAVLAADQGEVVEQVIAGRLHGVGGGWLGLRGALDHGRIIALLSPICLRCTTPGRYFL